jgi:hypothetical protein
MTQSVVGAGVLLFVGASLLGTVPVFADVGAFRSTITQIDPSAGFAAATFDYDTLIALDDSAGIFAFTLSVEPVATDIFFKGYDDIVSPASVPDHTTSVNVSVTTPGTAPGAPASGLEFGYKGTVGATPADSFLTTDIIGGSKALDFAGGGLGLASVGGTFFSEIVIVGDWSASSSHTAPTFAAGYSILKDLDFTYNLIDNFTFFAVENDSYTGIDPGISFSLIGSPVGVPEPASLALFGAGLGCLGVLRRRIPGRQSLRLVSTAHVEG